MKKEGLTNEIRGEKEGGKYKPKGYSFIPRTRRRDKFII